MDSSAIGGLVLAVFMIGMMWLPNYLFKPPKNPEEVVDNYIKEMIKKSDN